MLFDSHSHFNNEELTSLERQALFSLIDGAVREGKMSAAMDIGFDVPSSIMAAEHASRWPWCYGTAGCHPYDTKDMDDEKLEALRKLALQEKKIVAIGEIGLDYHFEDVDKDIQREWFRKQIRLANDLKMPIAVHARDADQEVMDILVEEGAFSEERKSWFPLRPDTCNFTGNEDATEGMVSDARVLLHCFSGSAELGTQYVKMGGTISVAGPVTFKNNRKTVSMVEAIPLDFLLVETDSPYLTPVPHRGKRNNPLMVEFTARKVAEIKGTSFEEVAEKTRDNARRFYGID